MNKLKTNFYLVALCCLFVSIPSYASIDTGLGNGLGGAVIDNATNGFIGVEKGQNSATLNFNQSAQVNWETLNLNSNETLNFNAVNGASGLTVVNTVNNGMSQIYGQINANSGISKLIISNPNGVLFDGARFTTAGDTVITTERTILNQNLEIITDKIEHKKAAIEITNGSEFNIGGEIVFVGDSIEAVQSAFKGKSVKFVTTDGAAYYLAVGKPKPGGCVLPPKLLKYNKNIHIDNIKINGNTEIISQADVYINDLETKGNLNVISKKDVDITGSLNVTGDTNINYGNVITLSGLDEQQKVLLNDNVDIYGTLTVNGNVINVNPKNTDDSILSAESDDNVKLLSSANSNGSIDIAQEGSPAFAYDLDDEATSLFAKKNVDGSVTVLYKH